MPQFCSWAHKTNREEALFHKEKALSNRDLALYNRVYVAVIFVLINPK